MDNDFYKAPDSNLSKSSKVKPSSIKAILYGSSFDIFFSIILGFVVVFFYSIYLASQGMNEHEILAQVQNFNSTSPLGIFTSVLGGLISVFAGYICAKKSVINIYRDGLITGIISTSFAWMMGDFDVSSPYKLFLSALTIVAVLAGVFIWRERNSK